MLTSIIAFSMLGPGRAAHTDLLKVLLLREPVGFVYDAHPANVDRVVERLHDFRTGKDLLTLRGSAPYSFALTGHPSQATLVVMGVSGRELRVGSVDLRTGLKIYDPPVVPIPVFDTGPPAPAGADYTISLQNAFATATDVYLGYEGPRIVKLSRRGLNKESQRLWGDAKSGGYNQVVEQWVYSPRLKAFAVAEEQIDEMATAITPTHDCGSGIYDPMIYFGKYDGAESHVDGEAACVVPCRDVDGFWVVFTDGSCRRFDCDSKGRYVPTGGAALLVRPKGDNLAFVPLQGVSDAAHECAYILTADRRRIATVSFRTGKPKVSYVKLDQPADDSFKMASAEGSLWLAAIDTSIRWYEKRQGKLALRFTSQLPKGEGFNALRD